MARTRLFSTVSLDIPWPEKGGKPVTDAWGGGKRGADSKYDVLPVHEIPGVIERSGVWNLTPDAHMYLWVTDTYLPHGLWVMATLGFKYRRQLVWPKDPENESSFGMGRYFRTKHEVILFGIRGQGMRVCTSAKNVTTLITEKREPGRRIHSRKPVEVYEKIEARSQGPFLEMFARQLDAPRPGWCHWGNDVDAKTPGVSLLCAP